MLLAWICVPILLFASATNALHNNRQLRHRLETGFGHRTPIKRSLEDVVLTVELEIDHFGGDQGTFKNRYWINDTYYDGGPVFVFDVGEANAELYYSGVLQEDRGVQSSVMALARKYKGLAILWEHRYYGESFPFQDKFSSVTQFTIDEWKYLTTDQALEDFAVFAKGFTLPSASQIKLQSADALKPQNTPWIVVGASYPGVRATLLRIRSPEVVFASWSSSAPVQAQIDMASYYEAVERALPRNCSSDWVAVTKYTDSVLMGSDVTEQIRVKRALYVARMSGPGGNTTLVQQLSDASVLAIPSDSIVSVLTDPLAVFQSFGLRTTLPFCDRLETRNFSTSPTSEGLAASQGINVTFDAFMTAIAEVDYDTVFGNNNNDPSDDYSWSWQFCSEFGYYQVADPNNPVNIVSTYNSLAAQQAWCDQMFNGTNPRQPNVTAVNKYGGWDMSPSNVFFSNGEYDPWRTLSINSQESNSPQRNGSETVPDCNVSPQSPSFFGATYPQQVHGADVLFAASDTQSEKDAYNKGVTLFSSALDKWLPCYNLAFSTGNDSVNSGQRSSSGRSLSVSILSATFLSFILA